MLDAVPAVAASAFWRAQGLLDIQAMLLQRAADNPTETPPLAGYSDDALVMELLNRGYRIDRPKPDA